MSFLFFKKKKQHKTAIYGPITNPNNCSSSLEEYSTSFSVPLLKTVVNHGIIILH